MQLRLLLMMASVFLMLATACGGPNHSSIPDTGNETGQGGSVAPGVERMKLTCGIAGDLTCDGEKEYCLYSVLKQVQLTSACNPLPRGCDTCDCTIQDAPSHFPTSNNCSGVIGCKRDSAGTSIRCVSPGMGWHGMSN